MTGSGGRSGIWSERVVDFRRHLLDLEASRYEGAEARADREAVFREATRLMQPVVATVLESFSQLYLDGLGTTSFTIAEPDPDQGLTAEWKLSWPAQHSARRRPKLTGPDGVGPITVRAIFPAGWTHGHLGGEHVGFWPLQVTSAADAERQEAIVWAIAEAELHEWIYQASEPWHSIGGRRDAATTATTAGGQLRAALASRMPVFGVFARNSISGELLDLARQLDLGFVVLDLEHGPTPPERELTLLAELAHLRGVALLVRIAAPEAHLAAKAMDLGACGVVIPNCESWAEAKAVVDACYLPPAGTRGYSPSSTRARLLRDSSSYSTDPTGCTNSQTVVVVQVESPSLAAELPSVVADDRVNALLLGLHDLEVRDPRPASEWQEMVRQAVKAKPQVAWGEVVDPEVIEVVLRLGARFLPLSSDSALLKQGLTDRISTARQVEGSF